MAGKKKFVVMLAGAAALALFAAGCDNVSGSGLYDEYTLAGKLENLDPNTAQNPHTIALSSSVSINMETAAKRDAWTAINTTIESGKKYVVLDLRRCAAPETLNGDFGGIIDDNAYIKGIVLPTTLTGIGNSAFSGCLHLTSVIIPESVTGIGNSAFEWCTGLTAVTIPDSVLAIGNHAFYNSPASLTNVTFGGSGTSFSRDSANESFPSSASLYDAYSAGGEGTYVRSTWPNTWAKQ